MKLQNKKAFSLIELSIVILIIGLLVAGIVKGRSLYTNMRVSSAASITNSSIVPAIPNLHVWYETSLDKSFNDNQRSDGSDVTTWYDIKAINVKKNNLVKQGSGNTPSYQRDCINNLPCLNFEGANLEFLVAQEKVNISGGNAKATIFIVGMKPDNLTNEYALFIGNGVSK